MQGDPRAIEDPISAVFELADEVDAQTPKIRRVLRYVRVFVWLWLVVDFLVIVSFSGAPGLSFLLLLVLLALFAVMRSVRERTGRTALHVAGAIVAVFLGFTVGPVLGIVLVPLFYLGLVILGLMRDLRGFFDYFALRHRVVQRVREADPVVYVPQGADAVRRTLVFLEATDPDIRGAMTIPGGLTAPALLQGKSRLAYAFDAYVRARPSRWWTWFGIGYTGLSAFVKSFDHAPTRSDLDALRRAVEDVCAATRVPPARVIAVWRATPGAQIAPDAYEFLVRESVHSSHRGNRFAASVELLTENEDGTYDRIPVVVASAISPAARTAPA